MIEIDKIHCGDSKDVMKDIDDDSVDLIVTDPPYSINFMQKKWDQGLPSVDIWRECLRVLKAGAFAFIMSSPRQDVLSRMIVNLEDAGFVVGFTSIYWTYASGFPKAGNISKLVDRRLGAEREIVGTYKTPDGRDYTLERSCQEGYNKTNLSMGKDKGSERRIITVANSDEAKALDGSYTGFNPKPALEIVLVVMKPLQQTDRDKVNLDFIELRKLKDLLNSGVAYEKDM